MKQIKVLRPRCLDCDFRIMMFDGNAKCAEGMEQALGKQFCSYGKKHREFRKSDPKVYPPSWCPRLKKPSVFRVYDFKDTESWLMHRMLKNDSVPPSYRCAVRTIGTTNLTPRDFYREALKTDVSTVLGIEVHSGEIIEIDDGMVPYCFYYSHRTIEVLAHWFPEKARSNIYKSDQSVSTKNEECEGNGSSEL